MARGQARILLVDDEQAVQTLLTYPLRKEGYDVVAATDGQQALDRFGEQRFDLWCSTSCCRSSTGSRSAGGCGPAARCRSSCSPPRGTRSTRWSVWRWAPTTTSPSPSRCGSSAAG